MATLAFTLCYSILRSFSPNQMFSCFQRAPGMLKPYLDIDSPETVSAKSVRTRITLARVYLK